MNYTKEQKIEMFKKFPQDLQEAILSTDTSDKLNIIYQKYNLMIDQMASLGDETGLYMFGITKQDEFIPNISKRLNIKPDIAQNIAREINEQIFKALRISLQKIQMSKQVTPQQPFPQPPQQPTPRPPITIPTFKAIPTIQTPYKNPLGSTQPVNTPAQTPATRPAPVAPIIQPTLEQAGRFTVDKPPVGFSSQYKEQSIKPESILKALENPETKMVDHLLSTPVTNSEKVEIKRETPPKLPVENKPYTVDPYREQF